jgi:hypothetical protein
VTGDTVVVIYILSVYVLLVGLFLAALSSVLPFLSTVNWFFFF